MGGNLKYQKKTLLCSECRMVVKKTLESKLRMAFADGLDACEWLLNCYEDVISINFTSSIPLLHSS